MNVALIFFLGDPQIAWGSALGDRGEQAGAEPAPFFVAIVDVEAAGAEFEDFLQHLDCAAQASGAGKRAVELGAAFFGFAGEFDSGEILAGEDLQVGKCFVVFELLIEFGLDVFDQPRFDEQGVDFAFGGEKIDVVNLADQVGGAALFGCSFEEITAGAGAEVLGFADVDHAADGVLHQVDAGCRGKFADFGERSVETAGGDWFRLGKNLVGRFDWLAGGSVIRGVRHLRRA